MRRKIVLAGLILLLVSFLTATARAELTSAERERVSNDLLAKIIAQYGQNRPVSPDSLTGQAFTDVVRHAKRQDIRYSVSMIENKEVNAVTLPNGHIVIFSGLLKALPKDDMNPVAFVLAHEISHIEKSHIEKKINQAAVTGTIISILTNRSNQVFQLLGVVANGLMTSGYSRDMEYEADREALLLMKTAGFDPNGALVVFNVLGQLESKKQGTRVFPTHPKAADRYKSVVTWMNSHGLAVNEGYGKGIQPPGYR